jgi:predicted dehydrogenase
MLSWAAQSSPFYFMSSHDIDLTCWYLGEQAQPLEVTAQDIRGVLDARKVAVQDGMNVLIRFKHAIANFHSSWIHPNSYPIVADGSMQVIGMTGVISYNNRLRKADIYHAYGGQELTFTGPATANEVNGKLAGAFVTSLRHFVECVITGQEPLTSPRRTLITSVIQTAAAQSLKINDKVTL